MHTPPPLSNFTGIKYWPTWLGMALLSVMAFLPFSVRVKAGELLGMMTYWLGKERRYITTVNICACFPELSEAEQKTLVKNSFQENGIGLIETVTSWYREKGIFGKYTTLIGFDKVQEAQAKGKGIFLIGAHYSTLDLGANLIAHFHPFATTYRPHKNALFDTLMLRGRLSNCEAVFDRNDIRGSFRHLKQGKTLWYAPDQDYGPDHAVFAPFFGISAATITAASRFASFNDSTVFILRHHRVNRTRQYEVEFYPVPHDFPGNDELKDATLINKMLEQAIRLYPAQYLWMHKRFKTQPGGKPNSPYIDIAAPNHRLTEKQYEQVISGAEKISELEDIHDFKLPSGLWLRQFPGTVGKRFYNRHPAKTFDRHAKALRLQGIPSITVDNFFRIPKLKISLATYFVPEGPILSELAQNKIPFEALAEFMAVLHNKGFDCKNPGPDQFIIHKNSFAILDPTGFIFEGKSISLKNRHKAIIKLLLNLNLAKQEGDLFFSQYAEAAGLQISNNKKTD